MPVGNDYIVAGGGFRPLQDQFSSCHRRRRRGERDDDAMGFCESVGNVGVCADVVTRSVFVRARLDAPAFNRSAEHLLRLFGDAQEQRAHAHVLGEEQV